jgi:ABC transporter substrate binding protein
LRGSFDVCFAPKATKFCGVRYWHKADIGLRGHNVSCGGQAFIGPEGYVCFLTPKRALAAFESDPFSRALLLQYAALFGTWGPMRRREFITLLGGAAAIWPLAVRAQQPEQVRRVGVLLPLAEDNPEQMARFAGLREGLERLGWSEGRNVRIDYRSAASGAKDFGPLAKELVALRPDVIFVQSTPFAAAVQRESRTIPIVFVSVSDPIGSGFVASLARPGGNLTGLLLFEASSASGFRCSRRWRRT